MLENIGEIFIRSFLSFSILLLLTRWMGKKQIAQLTHFDYVTAITVGSIAAAAAVEKDVRLLDGLAGLTFWTIFTILLNVIVLKSRKARKMLDGEACLVICNGQILEKNMKKMNYSLDDLMEELRLKDIFSISDVQFAVLESNGKLSIQLKPEKQPITRQDVHMPILPETLPVELIMDGQIIKQNLEQRKLTKDWLMDELRKRGIYDISEVVYATLGSDRKLYIDVRKDSNTEAFNVTD